MKPAADINFQKLKNVVCHPKPNILIEVQTQQKRDMKNYASASVGTLVQSKESFNEKK